MNTTKTEVAPEIAPVEKVQGNNKVLLVVLIILSSALDIYLTGIEIPWIISTFGGALVIDETIEYLISLILARTTLDVKLSKSDWLLGLLPIPGVTALSVHCFKRLFRKRK